MNNSRFASASRREVNLSLQVIEGEVPQSLYGVVFINSPCGTVNTDGLPYPETYDDGTRCEEHGGPLLNGDGLLLRIDFNQPGRVQVRTGLLKTPCYYADLATSRIRNPGNPWADMRFRMFGLARLSLKLGVRNQLNTAVIPFRFQKDGAYRTLATHEIGRPFEFDPETLEIITAIGKNTIWNSGFPPFASKPLRLVLTTAHPVFDPCTEEFFTVNFTKSDKQMIQDSWLYENLFEDAERLASAFKQLVVNWRQQGKSLFAMRKHVTAYLHQKYFFRSGPVTARLRRTLKLIRRTLKAVFYRRVSNPNELKIMRWRGTEEMDAWTVVDENGSPIAIDHSMHQIGFSKDYLILCDTNFKSTMDLVLRAPSFRDYALDAFVRDLLGGAMNDFSCLYIVRRSDLKKCIKEVHAIKIDLPLETVHFSVDYEDSGGRITIHSAHNCSSCSAEWLRSYDTLVTSPGAFVDPQKVGLFAIGGLDIGKIGRLVINVNRKCLVKEESGFLCLPGESDTERRSPHTWGLGLFTYRDATSSDLVVPKIRFVYWQSYGLRDDCLTQYIFDLYKDPSRSRTFSAEEMLRLTRMGARFVLQCVETTGLASVDHYTFAEDQYFWSLQFVPCKEMRSGVSYERNGCILVTVITKLDTALMDNHSGCDYVRELWLFDSNDLSAGPICRLSHPDLIFGFTLHSAWLPEAASPPVPDYALSVRDDYDSVLAQIPDRRRRAKAQSLFDQHVYPYFEAL